MSFIQEEIIPFRKIIHPAGSTSITLNEVLYNMENRIQTLEQKLYGKKRSKIISQNHSEYPYKRKI